MWAFTTLGKSSPISIVESFLERYGNKSRNHFIFTDNRGELVGSHAFQQIICKYNYVLETTRADSSHQNGILERGHRTLANMVRTMLHGADLGPEYWTYTISDDVYLRNRLPHSSNPSFTTPFERLTTRLPDLSHLCVFCNKVTVKEPEDHASRC